MARRKGHEPQPDEPAKPRGRFKESLYRMGVLVTPEEQARLRGLSFQERLLDTKIMQLVPAVPLVLLLGALYNGFVGLQWAAVICAVGIGGLYLYQSNNQGPTEPPPPPRGKGKGKRP